MAVRVLEALNRKGLRVVKVDLEFEDYTRKENVFSGTGDLKLIHFTQRFIINGELCLVEANQSIIGEVGEKIY